MFCIKYYWILYIYCTSAGIFSLFLFIHKQCENVHEWAYYYDLDSTLEKEFDYVVVGGGSAGSIVAGRLAENPKHQVLLIEAGGEPSAFFDIPLIVPSLQQSTLDWKYNTVPQKHGCYGLKNRESRWPAGKILGGSSRLNYMIYLRGHKLDYESWAYGNNWSFEDILFYFKKSENQLGKYIHNREYHATNGPVYVSDLRFNTDLVTYLLEAGQELGFKTVDLNDMISTPGFMSVQVTGYNGARWSADKALKYSLCSKVGNNLKIWTNTVVEKILFRNDFEAYGLKYTRNGQSKEVYFKKSAIISAGTVGTSKILLLSGIGPEQHLLKQNIKPIANLPVGENLQDHVTTGLDLIILNETLPLNSYTVLKTPIEAYNYFVNGQGTLTHPGCELTGLFHVLNDTKPDIQLMAMPAGVSTDAGVILKNNMGISDKIWEEYFLPLVGEQVVSILPVVLHPKSHGYVRLRSSDPKDPPLIDPKYLSHPYDLHILIEGLKLINKLINTASMKKLGARLYGKSLPGCEKYLFGSDSYWECYSRHITLTTYHPVGTCRMGLDHKSVVDQYLRVHKTNKLHVIDASVMPTLPSANINSAVMMVAEKGADIIKYLDHTSKHRCHLIEIFIPRHTTMLK